MKLHLDSFHPRPEGRGFSESLANLAYFVAFMVLVFFVAIFALSFVPKKAKERVEKKEEELKEEQKDIL